MISIELMHRGTSGSSGGWKYDYILKADDSDLNIDEFQAFQEIAAEAPESISDGIGGILYLADVQFTEFIAGPALTIAFASAIYAPPDEASPLGGTSLPEAVYEFAYQAPSEHIYNALSTTSYGSSPPNIKDKVYVNADGEHLGLDLPAGNTTNVWRLTVPAGFVTSTYEALVESMVGCVNSATFKGRPAGSMRFVQCQSSLTRGGSMSMTWGMQYSANRASFTYGGISVTSALGHELLWQLDEWKTDAGKRVLSPRAVYVQQVFRTADLNQLGF